MEDQTGKDFQEYYKYSSPSAIQGSNPWQSCLYPNISPEQTHTISPHSSMIEISMKWNCNREYFCSDEYPIYNISLWIHIIRVYRINQYQSINQSEIRARFLLWAAQFDQDVVVGVLVVDLELICRIEDVCFRVVGATTRRPPLPLASYLSREPTTYIRPSCICKV